MFFAGGRIYVEEVEVEIGVLGRWEMGGDRGDRRWGRWQGEGEDRERERTG